MTKRMKKRAKARRFHVWAKVGDSQTTVELPAGASDDECAAACQGGVGRADCKRGHRMEGATHVKVIPHRRRRCVPHP